VFFLTKGVDKLVTSGGFHDDDDEHHAFLYRLVFAACQRSKSCTYVMYVMYVRHVSHRDGYACRICVLDMRAGYIRRLFVLRITYCHAKAYDFSFEALEFSP